MTFFSITYFIYPLVAGYVPKHKSASAMMTCQSGLWTPPHEDKLACIEGVALITGGSPKGKNVEVWGPNGENKTLSDLPADVNSHSLDYLDGSLYLCLLSTCWKGEYDESSKGMGKNL